MQSHILIYALIFILKYKIPLKLIIIEYFQSLVLY